MKCELSLVVPFHNEHACAEQSLTELTTLFESHGVGVEIVAVDNGSTDDTRAILQRVATRHSNIRVMPLEANQGFGGALIQGFEQVSGPLIGFTCGDGEVDPQDLERMYHVLKTGAVDIAKGKRIFRKDGLWRRCLTFGYHLAVNILFWLRISDVNGYPVLMTRKAFQQMRLVHKDYTISVEILLWARRLGLRIAEVDVIHRVRAGGRSHVRWYYPLLFLKGLLVLFLQDLRRRLPAMKG